MNAMVPAALVPTDMDQAIRLAQAMSSSKMVPKHIQGDTGTCLMIIEQAMRWQMSPFAVAQCTASIGGKLVFEGKLVAAAVETSGAIEGHLDYQFAGEGDDRQVTVSARRRGETNPRQMTIKLKDVRTTNEHWKKQPDQMLVYSGTRNWARRWTPAVILGVYAPEEFSRDGKPADTFDGPTIDAEPDARDAINAAVPLKAAAAATPRPPSRSEGGTQGYSDDKWRVWLDKTRGAMDLLRSRQEVVEVGERESVANAIANGPDWLRRDLSALLAQHYARFPDDEPQGELPEVEIIGERNLAAG